MAHRCITAQARATARPAAARGTTGQLHRRNFAAGLLLAPALMAGPAAARDAKAAEKANEERKARLREAATGIAESGQDQRVFEDSNYAMSEEARTPNVHSRQDEGAKTSK